MMTDDQELFNLLILTRLSYFHLSTIVELYRRVGSATEIMSHRAHLEELDPEISPKIVSLLPATTVWHAVPRKRCGGSATIRCSPLLWTIPIIPN